MRFRKYVRPGESFAMERFVPWLFAMKPPDIRWEEPHLELVFEARALDEYEKLQQVLKKFKGLVYPNWREIDETFTNLDDPVLHSLYLHAELYNTLRPSRKVPADIEATDVFEKAELNQDPPSLGGRLALFVRVFPGFKSDVFINCHKHEVSNMQDLYKLVSLKLDKAGRDNSME